MKKNNMDIRDAANKAGIALWRIADRYGLSDSNFSKLLRKELNEEKRDKIFNIIEELRKEENGHEG